MNAGDLFTCTQEAHSIARNTSVAYGLAISENPEDPAIQRYVDHALESAERLVQILRGMRAPK